MGAFHAQGCNLLDFNPILKCSSQRRDNLRGYCPAVSPDESTAEDVIYWSLKRLIIPILPAVEVEDGLANKFRYSTAK